jgi:hypothetical protein
MGAGGCGRITPTMISLLVDGNAGFQWPEKNRREKQVFSYVRFS